MSLCLGVTPGSSQTEAPAFKKRGMRALKHIDDDDDDDDGDDDGDDDDGDDDVDHDDGEDDDDGADGSDAADDDLLGQDNGAVEC